MAAKTISTAFNNQDKPDMLTTKQAADLTGYNGHYQQQLGGGREDSSCKLVW